MKRIIAAIALAVIAVTGCTDDAQQASYNVSKAADNFEVQRRIVFVNGITDEYLLEVEGRCSIADDGNQLEVICKTGPDEFKKHFLGLSDNVTYFAEQIAVVKASAYRYRVTFKPEQLVPSVNLRTTGDEGAEQ